MRALRLHRLADGYAGCCLDDIETPVPAPGEVLIRVYAAALNFVDSLMTRGAYQTKPPLPFVLGSDVAGEVVGVGSDVVGLSIGQPVAGMHLGGAFAEFAALPAATVRPKPTPFTFSQAAAYGAAYYTAYVALTRQAHVKPGSWLLVHGASGGVGLAAVDVGKALGARVIATSGSKDKLKIIDQDYEPAAVLDTSKDLRAEVMLITDGKGVDIVFDPVGGSLFEKSVGCTAFGGNYLIVGFAGGEIPLIKASVPLMKGLVISGVRAGEYGRRFPERGVADRNSIWTLANDGRLKPRVHAEFPLEDWHAAFQVLQTRQAIGRVVLVPESSRPKPRTEYLNTAWQRAET